GEDQSLARRVHDGNAENVRQGAGAERCDRPGVGDAAAPSNGDPLRGRPFDQSGVGYCRAYLQVDYATAVAIDDPTGLIDQEQHKFWAERASADDLVVDVRQREAVTVVSDNIEAGH